MKKELQVCLLSLIGIVQSATADPWIGGTDLSTNEKPDGPQELSNPNSSVPTWSYGYRGAANDVELELFAASEHVNSIPGSEDFEGWSSVSLSFGVPLILCNVAAAPVLLPQTSILVNPNELDMHPGLGGGPRAYVVARWTAPTDGAFDITASWRDLDLIGGDGFSAHIILNGSPLFVANVPNQLSTTDSRTIAVKSGDKLDFVVGSGPASNYNDDSTGMTVTIVAAPVTTQAVIYPAVEIAWMSAVGITHQIQSSPTLAPATWTNFGDPVVGDGSQKFAFDKTRDENKKFYRVIEVP